MSLALDSWLGLFGAIAFTVLASAGVVMLCAGMIGGARFPDFFTRIHAMRIADSIGLTLLCMALACAAPDAGSALRIVVFGALVAHVSRAGLMMLASAAHSAGLAALAGDYAAPRPGAHRSGDTP